MSYFLTVDNLTFTYETAIDSLFEHISFQLDTAWTGVIGPNGCGKTTLLRLLCGQLLPDSGSITSGYAPVYCEQRTDHPPQPNTGEYLLNKYMAKFSCRPDWLNRWSSLSHGERKRLQLAFALAQEPDILAIDEPTNHLDGKTKNLVIHILKEYSGIGLIVSHDRHVLDTLCSRTLFIQDQHIRIFQSDYTSAKEALANEIQRQNQEFARHQKKIKKLKRHVTAQRQKADSADRRRSKKGLHKNDHDAKAKLDLVRYSGADANDGKRHKQLKSKLEQAENAQDTLGFTKEYDLGINFQAELNKRLFPITLQSSTLKLGENFKLCTPDLSVECDQKIGLTGKNGSGKSTLIQSILKRINIPSHALLYIPQEIDAQTSAALVKRILQMPPHQKGLLLSIVRRLGSDPKPLLTCDTPSPGETRKLLLAEGLLASPAMIIMDEPTNHMDLPSIEALERALNACPCAQLLVSHDKAFLNNIVSTFWNFQDSENNHYKIHVKSNPELR